jgi:hypothetical protein
LVLKKKQHLCDNKKEKRYLTHECETNSKYESER